MHKFRLKTVNLINFGLNITLEIDFVFYFFIILKDIGLWGSQMISMTVEGALLKKFRLRMIFLC